MHFVAELLLGKWKKTDDKEEVGVNVASASKWSQHLLLRMGSII